MEELTHVNFSFKSLFVPLTTAKAIIIFTIIGFIVYSNILFNAFVYDDYGQIVNNPLVHSLNYLRHFFTGGTFFSEEVSRSTGIYYKPLLSTIFAFLYTISGPQPFIFHLFQVLLHIINTSLIYVLFQKFFKNTLSFFLALIFLVHPINQESVAYISDLQEPLFLFFGILALLMSTVNITSIRRIILINIFLLLGLLSKETAILFVPILFLYTYLWNRKSFSKSYYFTITFTTLFYLLLRLFVIKTILPTIPLVPIMNVSLLERITTMPSIIFYYLKIFFFPSQLALGHSWVVTNLSINQFYLPLIIDLLSFIFILYLGIFLQKNDKKLFTVYIYFSIWSVIGILMHLQIIPLDSTVADRWFYFPIIGILGLLGIVINFYWCKKEAKGIIITIGIVIIILLAGRTMVRNTNWINSLTLCQHDLQIVSKSYILQSVCGGELLTAGQYEEAKKYYTIAVSIMPNLGRGWYELGLSYEYTKDITKAREYYRKSIKMDKAAKAYVSLTGTYLKYENNPKTAKEIAEEGLKKYPNYQTLQLFLAISEYRLGNREKALEIAIKTDQLHQNPVTLYVLNQIYNNQEVDPNRLIAL